MENLISVIVITYNQETTISRTLDSILMQQCHLPIEIVIGEDCSTDGTGDICRQYQQQHPDIIRLFSNETNKGIVDNYFDCLLACRGKYIADCAGDDFWIDERKLEKELLLMERHPAMTLVHTAWQYYDEKTRQTIPPKITRHYPKVTKGQDMLHDIISYTDGQLIHLCSSLYRKDVFLHAYKKDINLFRNKDFGCEDMQIVFVMAQAGDIGYLPDITLNYSCGKTTASMMLSHENDFQFTLRILHVICYISKKYHIFGHDIEASLSTRLYALMMHAFRAHQPALRDKAIAFGKEKGIATHTRHHLVCMIMSNDILWRMALVVRGLFVRVKKHLK